MDRSPDPPPTLKFHVISGGVSETIGHVRILNLGERTL